MIMHLLSLQSIKPRCVFILISGNNTTVRYRLKRGPMIVNQYIVYISDAIVILREVMP